MTFELVTEFRKSPCDCRHPEDWQDKKIKDGQVVLITCKMCGAILFWKYFAHTMKKEKNG